MSKNTNLHNAKNAKQDEFYTQMSDIEIEMNAYIEHNKDVFKDKTILCNCDDPYESNFFKFFSLRFNDYGLKRLIATCYDNSPITGTQLSLFDKPEEPGKTAYKVVINEVKDFNGDGAVDLSDVEYLIQNEKNVLTKLKGNGDFRSDECIELLKQADIVVTNPPWSLYREYVNQLVKYKKQFIILGNKNSVTYKEIFPLIKENKMWIGQSIHSGGREFMVPSYYNEAKKYRVDKHGNKYVNFPGPRWFTNIPIKNRYEPLQLMTIEDNLRFNKQLQKALNKYNCDTYPKYDNYNAIEVPTTAAIPKDYAGIMGVPITFLDKYCPEQFDIMGADGFNYFPAIKTYNRKQKVVNGKKMKSLTGTLGCTIKTNEYGKGTYFDVGYPVISTYKRIFIKYTDKWKEEHPQDFKEE